MAGPRSWRSTSGGWAVPTLAAGDSGPPSVVLSATCACGRSVVVPCPTLGEADRATAFAAIEDAGWLWIGDRGYRCPSWPGCEAQSGPSALRAAS